MNFQVTILFFKYVYICYTHILYIPTIIALNQYFEYTISYLWRYIENYLTIKAILNLSQSFYDT